MGTGNLQRVDADSGPAAPSGPKLHPEFVAVGGGRWEADELAPRTSASSAALASLVDFLTQQGHFGQHLVVEVAPPGVVVEVAPPPPLVGNRGWKGPLLHLLDQTDSETESDRD